MVRKLFGMVILGLFMLFSSEYIYAGDFIILDKEIEAGEIIDIEPDFSNCKTTSSIDSKEMMSRKIKIQIKKKDIYSFYWTSYFDTYMFDYYMDLYDEEGNYIKSLNDFVDEIEPENKNVFGPIIYDLDEGVYYISFYILNYENYKFINYNSGKNVDFSYKRYVLPKKGDIINSNYFTYRVKKECVVDFDNRKVKKRGELELINVEKNKWKNIYIMNNQLYWGTSTLTWGIDGKTYGVLLYDYEIVKVSCKLSERCKNLKSVTLSCDGISNNTYIDLKRLKKLRNLSLYVKKLPRNGLSNFRNVRNVYFRGKSINIPKNFFHNCKKLKMVNFCGERIKIGKRVFVGCKKLKKIKFESDSHMIKNFRIAKNSFYTKANSKLKIFLVFKESSVNRMKNKLEGCSFSNKVTYEVQKVVQ